MNYEEMIDFEINQAVAEIVSGDVKRYGEVVMVWNGQEHSEVDYCNNPLDALPIIDENRINLISPIETRDSWTASHTKGGGNWSINDFSVLDKNPLRAAMIVFLMMQENAQ